jgi:4-hydroxybenzoate polyprenyltransferase
MKFQNRGYFVLLGLCCLIVVATITGYWIPIMAKIANYIAILSLILFLVLLIIRIIEKYLDERKKGADYVK